MHLFIPTLSGFDQIEHEYINLVDQQDTKDIVISYDSLGNVASRFDDQVWDFTAYVSKKLRNNYFFKIDFHTIPEAWRGLMRHAIYHSLWEKKRSTASFEAPFRKFETLRKISNALAERGYNSPSILNSDRAKPIIVDILAKKNLAPSTISKYLSHLNAFAEDGYSRLTFDNIEATASSIADSSIEIQQTLFIPQDLASHIFRTALEEVETYYEKRFEIRELFSEYLKLLDKDVSYDEVQQLINSSGLVSIDRYTPTKHKEKTTKTASFGLTKLKMFYNDILAACGTLIGGTTGMRQGEWFELSCDSFKQKTIKGAIVSFLKGATTKLNGGYPLPHAWVCAPQTEKAIELAAFISEPFRNQVTQYLINNHQEDKLLKSLNKTLFLRSFPTNTQINEGNLSTPVSTLNSAIRRLSSRVEYQNKSGQIIKGARLSEEHMDEYNSINKQNKLDLKVGDMWPLASHQYRRTFAIFFIRNGFGSFLQIKRQFAHIHLAMSMWYGRNSELALSLDTTMDEEIQSEIEKVNLELATEILSDIYLNDNKTLSGGAGKKIQEDKMHGRIIFSTRDDIQAAILRGEISVVDNGTSLCLNPNCDRLDCLIDPAVNGAKCKSDILDENHAKQRIPMRERLISRYEKAASEIRYQPNTLSKIKAGIRGCEKVMRDHGIDFDSYKFKEQVVSHD